ncbi:MAG: hypothetical protein QUV02_12555 [Maricaulis sp.]|jgi:hypothetical protein|nr:hypothetical protein [Maricaulis sp.]MDM7985272.1 hypothetical protein [Maricaulis sp.]
MRAHIHTADLTRSRPSITDRLSRIPNRVWVSIIVVMLIGLG